MTAEIKPGYFINNPSIYSDTEFTENPEVSFFKIKHYRHVPFSMQNIDILLNSNLTYGKDTECILPKHGDLIHKMYLSIELPALPEGTYWRNSIGYAIIDYIEVYIDSQKIDRQTGEWMNINHELFTKKSKINGLNEMVGKYNTTIELKKRTNSGVSKNITVPLYFWFCRDIDKSLPLVAMRNSELRFIIKLKPFNEVILGTPISETSIEPLRNIKLMTDYIFIDDEERMKFITNPIEYNIEQIEYQDLSNNINYNVVTSAGQDEGKYEFELEANGLVKYIVWVLQDNTATDFVYNTNNLLHANLLINGTYLVKKNKKGNNGLNQYISYYSHNNRIPYADIHSFPMCLNMDSSIPNGATNVSNVSELRFEVKLDTTKNTNSSKLNMFFVRYNVLKFDRGTGLTLFS